MPADRCYRGHIYPLNEQRFKSSVNGKTYVRCRACQRARQKLRYRNDTEFREREKIRCLTRYRTRTGDQHV